MFSEYHEIDADVIIIGAGIAGLAAAHFLLLKDPSLYVIILESSNRIGGRTFSQPLLVTNNKSHNFDVGGQYINPLQTRLLKLLNKFSINVYEKRENGHILISFNKNLHRQSRQNPFGFSSVTAKIELTNFIIKIEKLCKEETINPQIASQTMHSFIENNLKHEINKAIVKWIILIYCGVYSKDISVGFYIFFCSSTYGITNQLKIDANGLYGLWFQNGAQELYDNIMNAIKDDIILEKNTEVKSIHRTKMHIEIKTTNDTYYSNCVIIAIPPPKILKIEFTPALPQYKIKALKNSVFGEINKFVVTYKEAFWKKNNLCGDIYILDEYSQEYPLLCCFNTSIESYPTLIGYFLNVKNDVEVETIVLQELSKYLGDKALEPLQFAYEIWDSGSPMCCYKCSDDVYEMQSKTERLFWAGAETSTEWYGSICGAVISGKRVAHEVIYDLRPSSLTVEDMEIFALNWADIQRRTKSHDNIFKKLLDPYNQIYAIFIFAVAIAILRKTGLLTRLKNILIKK